MIPVADILPADSPRMDGESSEHVQRIADSGTLLPPIIVHRQTMRVIDGMHRLKAAVLRGAAHIEARLYDGDVDDAFVLAVQANARHGLPLSRQDRVNAATRIVASHPTWSDRAIASAAGLSPKTVAAIRLRSVASPEPVTRIGMDGRARPISTAARRQLAGELLTRSPDASLRQIANAVGLAPSTIMDVRARLRAGQDLVPGNQRSDPESRPWPHRKRRTPADDGAGQEFPAVDRARTIRVLMQDPSLRFSETGRRLLRWLEAQPNAFPDWQRVVDNVPEHWLAAVAELARDSVRSWSAVVDRLERRAAAILRQPGSGPARPAEPRPPDPAGAGADPGAEPDSDGDSESDARRAAIDRLIPRPR